MLTILLSLSLAACRSDRPCPDPAAVPADEHADTIEALRPPLRDVPVIAVVAASEGTETTDFLIPYAVLSRAGGAVVIAVATEPGPVELMPALTVEIPVSIASFERTYPDGADYVVVPALHHPDNKDVAAFVTSQHALGATVVGVCSGARVLALAGLLADRDGTGHWYDRRWLERHEPSYRWVSDRRYVVRDGVATTTGVTASMPASLALVEAIAGEDRARAVADELGAEEWSGGHDSDAFASGGGFVGIVVRNELSVWNNGAIGIPVADGADDVALAFAADAWSRTYTSRAVTVAPTPRIRLASGLLLDVDREDIGDVWPVPEVPPAEVLDETLAAIDDRFGARTAGWVARQLEYPGYCGD